MTTYTELITQIREYTETDSNVLTDTIIDDFIEHTENRILRELNIPAFVSHQFANFTASNAFLSLPGGAGPTPDIFTTINSMMIYSPAGTGDRTFLERKDVSFMNEYWPDRAVTGTPKYYSQWDDNTVYVVPTPDVAYTVEMSMSKLPDRLSAATNSTWISNNAPTLLLYGCLIEAFKYLKGPAEMLQMYSQSYATALEEVATQYMGMGKRDAYQSGVIRIPRPSFQPGLGSMKSNIGGPQ